MTLPKSIVEKIAKLSNEEIKAVKELKRQADIQGGIVDRAYSSAEILRLRGEHLRAAQGLTGVPVRERRHALAQILCLCGSNAKEKRGKWSDDDVLMSNGMYGDAEWTSRAKIIADAITKAL